MKIYCPLFFFMRKCIFMKMPIRGPLTEGRLDVGQGDEMCAIMYYTPKHCPPEDLCSSRKMSNSFLLCN